MKADIVIHEASVLFLTAISFCSFAFHSHDYAVPYGIMTPISRWLPLIDKGTSGNATATWYCYVTDS